MSERNNYMLMCVYVCGVETISFFFFFYFDTFHKWLCSLDLPPSLSLSLSLSLSISLSLSLSRTRSLSHSLSLSLNSQEEDCVLRN